MTSKWIREKIKNTRLFSDAQKVELLVALDDASPAEVKKLEAGIDTFEREYAKTVKKHTAQIRSILGHAVKGMSKEEKQMNQDAIDEIQIGLSLLTP